MPDQLPTNKTRRRVSRVRSGRDWHGKPLPLPELFWRKVDQRGPTECWPWIGPRFPEGYGFFSIGIGHGKSYSWLAHRLSLIMSGRDFDPALTIDHLCRNKPCVNPDHLEPVTLHVNILRGNNMAARNARKETCIRGHAFVGLDKYGCRVCGICNRGIWRPVDGAA